MLFSFFRFYQVASFFQWKIFLSGWIFLFFMGEGLLYWWDHAILRVESAIRRETRQIALYKTQFSTLLKKEEKEGGELHAVFNVLSKKDNIAWDAIYLQQKSIMLNGKTTSSIFLKEFIHRYASCHPVILQIKETDLLHIQLRLF